MKVKKHPTQEELREMFTYDPHTGRLVWKKIAYKSTAKVGEVAGSIIRCPAGSRWRIGMARTIFFNARLVWIYHYGDIPQDMQIDHKNQNTLDDRIENLRLASSLQQKWHSRPRKNNPLPKGVIELKRGNKRFRADIRMDGKKRTIGYYSTAEEAHEAYKKIAQPKHKEFLNLNTIREDVG